MSVRTDYTAPAYTSSFQLDETLLLELLRKELLIYTYLEDWQNIGVDTEDIHIDIGLIILKVYGFPVPDDTMLLWFYGMLNILADQLRRRESSLNDLVIELYDTLRKKKKSLEHEDD